MICQESHDWQRLPLQTPVNMNNHTTMSNALHPQVRLASQACPTSDSSVASRSMLDLLKALQY